MSALEGGDFLNSLGEELALALGQAVWAFARIEWLTYEYMRALSHDSLDDLMGDQLFRARTKLTRQLVERLEDQASEKAAAFAAIERAMRLADRRNTIVHNPWQIWIDIERKDFLTEIQKYNHREKRLDLCAVKAFTQEASQTASALQTALTKLIRPSSAP